MTTYSVSGGLLLADGHPVQSRPSPNIGGPIIRHRLLVHHFTGGSFEGAVEWLCKPRAKASAHLVVAEDGEVVQLVPFDRAAWHAGRSAWGDVSGSVNPVSIGIEIANLGDLDGSPGAWRSDGGARVPDDRVIVARHKAEGSPRPWHTYPPAQVAAVIAISRALHEAYHFEALVGHDDVSPGRKVDPGPAWPMDMVRPAVMWIRPVVAEAPVPTVVETPRDVQRALNLLGYGPLQVDGAIGPASEAAVIRFQHIAGVAVDGDPGPKTRRALVAALSRKA